MEEGRKKDKRKNKIGETMSLLPSESFPLPHIVHIKSFPAYLA